MSLRDAIGWFIWTGTAICLTIAMLQGLERKDIDLWPLAICWVALMVFCCTGRKPS